MTIAPPSWLDTQPAPPGVLVLTAVRPVPKALFWVEPAVVWVMAPVIVPPGAAVIAAWPLPAPCNSSAVSDGELAQQCVHGGCS